MLHQVSFIFHLLNVASSPTDCFHPEWANPQSCDFDHENLVLRGRFLWKRRFFGFLSTLNMICRNEILKHGQPIVETTPQMWKGQWCGNYMMATFVLLIWGWITTVSPETMCGCQRHTSPSPPQRFSLEVPTSEQTTCSQVLQGNVYSLQGIKMEEF